MRTLALLVAVVCLSGCSWMIAVHPIIGFGLGRQHHRYDPPQPVVPCPPKKVGCIDDSGMGKPEYRP